MHSLDAREDAATLPTSQKTPPTYEHISHRSRRRLEELRRQLQQSKERSRSRSLHTNSVGLNLSLDSPSKENNVSADSNIDFAGMHPRSASPTGNVSLPIAKDPSLLAGPQDELTSDDSLKTRPGKDPTCQDARTESAGVLVPKSRHLKAVECGHATPMADQYLSREPHDIPIATTYTTDSDMSSLREDPPKSVLSHESSSRLPTLPGSNKIGESSAAPSSSVPSLLQKDRRLFRTVVPARVFLNDPGDFPELIDSFSPPQRPSPTSSIFLKERRHAG